MRLEFLKDVILVHKYAEQSVYSWTEWNSSWNHQAEAKNAELFWSSEL